LRRVQEAPAAADCGRGSRHGRSESSSTTAGAFWCFTYDGALDAELFIVFWQPMMKCHRRPVHLVLDLHQGDGAGIDPGGGSEEDPACGDGAEDAVDDDAVEVQLRIGAGAEGGAPRSSRPALAPLNNDPGNSHRRRSTWGSRSIVRGAPYVATLNTVRCDPLVKNSPRLLAAGKPKKVALIACSHKLPRILSAMARDGQDPNPELHGPTHHTSLRTAGRGQRQ
jgi:hypothetical protein